MENLLFIISDFWIWIQGLHILITLEKTIWFSCFYQVDENTVEVDSMFIKFINPLCFVIIHWSTMYAVVRCLRPEKEWFWLSNNDTSVTELQLYISGGWLLTFFHENQKDRESSWPHPEMSLYEVHLFIQSCCNSLAPNFIYPWQGILPETGQD